MILALLDLRISTCVLKIIACLGFASFEIGYTTEVVRYIAAKWYYTAHTATFFPTTSPVKKYFLVEQEQFRELKLLIFLLATLKGALTYCRTSFAMR